MITCDKSYDYAIMLGRGSSGFCYGSAKYPRLTEYWSLKIRRVAGKLGAVGLDDGMGSKELAQSLAGDMQKK